MIISTKKSSTMQFVSYFYIKKFFKSFLMKKINGTTQNKLRIKH